MIVNCRQNNAEGLKMMDNINEFYKRFVDEAYDENGVVCKFDLDLPDNYNFAYDVIDAIAALEPDRVALA